MILFNSYNPELATLHPLARSFLTLNPGGELVNAEAKRQLISFCSSLRNTELRAPPPRIPARAAA